MAGMRDIRYIYGCILIMFIFLAGCSKQISEDIKSSSDTSTVPAIDSYCPKGEADCQYPGKCGAYTDSDGNYLCDNNQV
jgi:hypothetical protein